MDGVVRIDKVVAFLEVWLDATFPIAKMKVKVLVRSGGDFLAISNLNRLNPTSREPEYTSGLGSSVEEAVNDLLGRFVSEARENQPSGGFAEEDFEWSDPEDF